MNEVYGYRVKYPAGWTISDTNPAVVTILDPERFGQLHLSMFETEQQTTLDAVVKRVLRASRARMNGVMVLAQQDTTLPSGQKAHVIDVEYDNPNDSFGLFRTKFLVTVRRATAYQVEFGRLKTAYTPAVDRLATRIVESFTLSDRKPTITEQTSTDTQTEQNALDLTPQATYTNDVYPYRIQYPANWTVHDSTPSNVAIADRDRDTLRITVRDGSNAPTLTAIVDTIIASTRQQQSSVTVLDRHVTTLANGLPAQVIYMTHDLPDDTAGLLRSYSLITKQDSTIYDVQFVANDADWTQSIERAVEELVTSFTITARADLN